jgi:hypothetical protein
MKPRLHPAVLTNEDREIMGLCVACSSRRENEFCWCSRYYVGDRRDADLMFEITEKRSLLIEFEGGFSVRQFSRERILQQWSS